MDQHQPTLAPTAFGVPTLSGGSVPAFALPSTNSPSGATDTRPSAANTLDINPESSPARLIVTTLSVTNAFGLIVLCFLLYVVSEDWWFSMALTYLPRSPYLVGPVVLLLLSVRWHRKMIWVNVVALVIALVPIMGLMSSSWNGMSLPGRIPQGVPNGIRRARQPRIISPAIPGKLWSVLLQSRYITL